MKIATRFLAQSGRPAHTPIIRVTEGAENAAFKVILALLPVRSPPSKCTKYILDILSFSQSFFSVWDPPQPLDFSKKPSVGIALSPRSVRVLLYYHYYLVLLCAYPVYWSLPPWWQEFNVSSMFERVKHEEMTVDDDGGSDKLQIWRIENMDKVPIPQVR